MRFFWRGHKLGGISYARWQDARSGATLVRLTCSERELAQMSWLRRWMLETGLRLVVMTVGRANRGPKG